MTFPMQAQRERLHIAPFPYVVDDDEANESHWFKSHIITHATALYALLSGSYVFAPAVGYSYILDPTTAVVAVVNASVSMTELPILYHTLNTTGFNDAPTYDPSAQVSWDVLQQINSAFPDYIPHEQGNLVPHREVSAAWLKTGEIVWSE